MLGYKITLATTIQYSPLVMIFFEFVYHEILILWVNITLDPMLVMLCYIKLIRKHGPLITQKYHGSVGPFHSLIIHIRPIFLCIGSVGNVYIIFRLKKMSQKDSHRKCLSLMNFCGWVDIIWTNTVWFLNIKPNLDLNSGIDAAS